VTHPRKRRMAQASCAFIIAACAVRAQTAAPANDAVQPDPVVMPKMTVNAYIKRYFPPFPKADVTAPNFSDKEPSLSYMLSFPGKAYAQGVSTGRATVGVMLDAAGKPEDFLLIRYSQPYFGDALMHRAREMSYTPLRIKGSAVPGRFDIGYQFTPDLPVVTNAMFDAINERFDVDIDGGARFVYAPHEEMELDEGRLYASRSAVPLIPDGYHPVDGKAPQAALVTFYVDEAGRVRLPNVESAESPLLVPNLIKAIKYWQFKAPTVKGRPVLVYTARALPFQAAGTP
jgi:outer membrane biosynthesis protein TonB